MSAQVLSVSRSDSHSFSKHRESEIMLIAAYGVQGDAHAGKFVQHRSRIKKNPTQPNLRQVHLIHQELFDELRNLGYSIEAGQIGENITTKNLDLLKLPTGTRLKFDSEAEIEITGLRNPCHQLNSFQDGLMKQLIYPDANGTIIRKSGVMGIVVHSGIVKPGDRISVTLPELPHRQLTCV